MRPSPRALGPRALAALAALTLASLMAACQTTGSTASLRPSVAAQELIGRDGGGVTSALGEPKRIRKEDAAQVWQYDGGSCVLDLFLYPEGAGHRVVHLEARDALSGQSFDANRCVAQVQNPTRAT